MTEEPALSPSEGARSGTAESKRTETLRAPKTPDRRAPIDSATVRD